jgi:hypothetical protein
VLQGFGNELKDQARVADVDYVTILELAWLGHSVPVDPGAVAATEVIDPVRFCTALDQSMATRGRLVRDHDVVVGAPT